MRLNRLLLLAMSTPSSSLGDLCSPAISAAANAFIDARLNPHISISCPTGISTIAEGYQVQKEMLKSSEKLGGQIGWKCGATNAGAQAAMKFGPFYGPLFSNCLVANNGNVTLSSLGSFRANEAEFCFFMKDDCPLKDTPYTTDEIWERVEAIAGSIELAATRLSASPLPPHAVLGDFALNGCCVIGEKIPAANFPSSSSLVEATAELAINAGTVAKDIGGNVLGNPVSSLAWLANELIASGQQLRAGDMVMSGAAAASKALSAGDRLEARFSHDLGTVSVNISE